VISKFFLNNIFVLSIYIHIAAAAAASSSSSVIKKKFELQRYGENKNTNVN
jgi:hypothetical protein